MTYDPIGTSVKEVSGPEMNEISRPKVGQVKVWAIYRITYISPIIVKHCRTIRCGLYSFTACMISIQSVDVVSRWILTGRDRVGIGPSSFNHLRRWRQNTGNDVTEPFPVRRACFLYTDLPCLGPAHSIPTILHRGGRKPEVVFRDGSLCDGHVFSMTVQG